MRLVFPIEKCSALPRHLTVRNGVLGMMCSWNDRRQKPFRHSHLTKPMICRGRLLRQQLTTANWQHIRGAHSHSKPFFTRLLRCTSSHISQLRTQSLSPHAPFPRPAAFNPISFIVAASLAAGVAYIATKSRSKEASPSDASEQLKSIVPSAQQHYHVMAPFMPPGRPGTLTSDQEVRLKDMWTAPLEVFGVSHETHANGIATPDSTPDPKEKKKSRLSMFRSQKGKDTDSGIEGQENDKHGQTREFERALAQQSPESLREAFWSMSKHDHPDAL